MKFRNSLEPVLAKKTAPEKDALCIFCNRESATSVRLSAGNRETLTVCQACFFKMLGGRSKETLASQRQRVRLA